MPPMKNRPDPKKESPFVIDMRSGQAPTEDNYRSQALKLFPHVCARCCREFSGKKLRELTVHHKDNDHMNNPPDGSNWELLCVYCHDDAHQSHEKGGRFGESAVYSEEGSSSDFNPFAGLKNLLKPKDDDPKSG